MIANILTTWSDVMAWIITALGGVQEVFYDAVDGTLTFLGTLAVISVAIGIAFLLIGVIQNFLRLRG